MGKAGRILIAAFGGVGDVVFFLPTLHALRQTLPGARIDALVFPNGVADLLQDTGLIDSVFVFPHPKYRKAWNRAGDGWLNALWQRWRTVLALRATGYDLCVWPFQGVGGMTAGRRFLHVLAGVERSVVHRGTLSFSNLPWPPSVEYVPYLPHDHVVDRNLALLDALGIRTDGATVKLPVRSDSRTAATELLERLGRSDARLRVGLQPGGNLVFTSSRQWPPSHYATLADLLHSTLCADVLLLGTPAESAVLKEIESRTTAPVLRIDMLPLHQVIAMIEQLDLFIGNDSALVHIAASLGVPTLAVHGPTDVKVTGPRGLRAHAIRLDLPCSPCFDTGFHASCPHRRCLTDLPPAQVLAAARTLLETAESAVTTCTDLPTNASAVRAALPPRFWRERELRQRNYAKGIARVVPPSVPSLMHLTYVDGSE